MKRIDEIINSVIKENKVRKKRIIKENDLRNYFIFKSYSGGVLAIPKNASPQNINYVDISSWKSRSTESIMNEWAVYGSVTPKKVCETYHKDENLDLCIAKGYDIITNKLANGGVTSFTAISPVTKLKTNYRGCWRKSEKGGILDFDKIYFAGYYASKDNNGSCSGEIWSIDTNSKKGKGEMSITYGDKAQGSSDSETFAVKINIILDK